MVRLYSELRTSFSKSANTMEQIVPQMSLLEARKTVLKNTCPISGSANKVLKYFSPAQGEWVKPRPGLKF